MGTLTALLHLSQSALETNQAAIDITSNNVANANTPGYTRQVPTWQESDTVFLNSVTGAGAGASVTMVSQRDAVLNQRVQQQTQLESSSSIESTALTALQSIFGITSTSASAVSTTIGTDINAFFSSLSALEASPSDASVRQGVLSAAETLASDFNGTSNQIAQQASGLNQQASGVVSQVNALTASIAALNLQIRSASPSGDAGALEDLRQLDLSKLSTYIGFDQTKTEGNGLTLTTADSAVLVSEDKSFALTTVNSNGNVNVLSAAGQDLTSQLDGGSLGGILQARDRDLPQVSSALDALAYAIGSAVNAQNQAGLDANGNPGGAIFNLPAGSSGAAAAISVATSDPKAIAAASVGQGSSGGANATALSALVNARLLDGQTTPEFYASLLTQLGGKASAVSEENTTQQGSLTQLLSQQSAQSSVSLDEEAANLMLYERSYAAAAKVFTIVDQLMASALNLGQQTTVV
ncbi:MAG TPA: flagellar hook-associated protein FlgK [Acidobacteriaceae bacterium]